jgi:antitoxin component HigA of HigAB toxin-antitoxin module
MTSKGGRSGFMVAQLLDELKHEVLDDIQAIMSELLNEKRESNLKQIKSLSERFHVSPLAFI